MLSKDDAIEKRIFRRSLWSVTSENDCSVPFQDIDVVRERIFDLLRKRQTLWKEWENNMNIILDLERHGMNASYRRGLYCEETAHMDKDGAEIIHDLRKNVRQIQKKIKKTYTGYESIIDLEDELLAVINEDDFVSWILENLEMQLSSSMEILADALESHESDRQRINELTEYMRLAEKALQRVASGPKLTTAASKGKVISLSRPSVRKKSSNVFGFKSSAKFISTLENDMSALKLKDEFNEIHAKLKRRKIQERVLQEKVHELLGQITAIDTDAALIHGLVTKLIPERRRIQDHKWLGKVIPLTVTAHETSIRLGQFHETCKDIKEELRNVEDELICALSSWDAAEIVEKQGSDEQLALPPPPKEKETDLLKYFRSVWAILRPKIQMLSDHATNLQDEVKASEWKLIEFTQKEMFLERKIERLEIKLIEKGRRSMPSMKQRLTENLIRFKFLKEDTALENQYISNLENDIKAFRAETLIMESLKFRIDQDADEDFVKRIMKASVKDSYAFCFFCDKKLRRRDSKRKRSGSKTLTMILSTNLLLK